MEQGAERVIKSYILANARVFYSNHIRAKFAGASLAARHTTIAWRLANPNRLGQCLKLAEAIALASNSKAVMSYRDHRFVVYQFQLSERYWQEYTRQDVKNLGVGLADRRRQVDIQFLESAPQIGIFGTTGSGKTELIKSAICALASEYRPDELKFLISDWHAQLTEFEGLAHLAMPIVYNDDYGTDKMIEYANQIYTKRGLANDCRLVFVIDEAADIVTTKERVRVIGNVANSRKWKINLILGTQKPDTKTLPNIIDKINNRFVGLLSDGPLSARVTGQAGLQAHKLTGAGDFWHIIGPTHERFQVARVTERDIARLPRAEIKEPEIEALLATPIPVESNGPGRPKSEVEAKVVADYLANYEMSVRAFMKEFNCSQNKYYLHKNFAEELKEELARYGLGICNLEEAYG
jgi:hypothetical protein